MSTAILHWVFFPSKAYVWWLTVDIKITSTKVCGDPKLDSIFFIYSKDGLVVVILLKAKKATLEVLAHSSLGNLS